MSNDNHLPDRNTFAARNGDTLHKLNLAKMEAQKHLDLRRRELALAEELIKPAREAVERAEGAVQNLSCRLNIWWREFGIAGGKEPSSKPTDL